MNGMRNVGLIALGMLLAVGLLWGVATAFAQEPGDGLRGWMHESMGDMMGGEVDHDAMHESMAGMMQDMDHDAMHRSMHDGEAMPEECQTMMDDPAVMGEMMERMHDDRPMSLDEAREWMTEHGISAETQAQCLEHMADHHPRAETPSE